MMKQITPWLKGVLAPVLVMVIFAIPVGVFMALALLVFAMEEGGETMSSFAVPLTRVIVLLSQGIGMHAGAITLTITPLLLTLAMILLIRAVYSPLEHGSASLSCGRGNLDCALPMVQR